MTDDQSWLERMGIRLRAIAEYLRDHGGSGTWQDAVRSAGGALDATDDELVVDKQGRTSWERSLLWQTTGMVKAGWIVKDGNGTWSITDKGVEALDRVPDPVEYFREITRLYADWKRNQVENEPRRRAWLIRGSSVMGVDLVPSWLDDGFVSIAASQLREPPADVDVAALESIVRFDYAHLGSHELKSRVDETIAFVCRMIPGDVVLATSGSDVFLGDVTGEWEFGVSDGGRSNLRRAVDWRNPDAALTFDELPDPLPARLQSGHTVVDLTADLALIDSLRPPGISDSSLGDGGSVSRPSHEHLPPPSDALADDLFVDMDWLTEVAELLDERRQVIFYGPPGTGKTFIARKLAADLVGPEQVKLVQFHPAYTYEDFFEGYRPTPGTASGTISFELKAGPLRQLVNRAREHPDQAFVLIIDEINRANLAKVFGELYFLLEYRDQAVDLLYSSDEEGFTLPKNLYLIGTMNTADRSIALIDAAMRRRFAFVELSPDTEPTKSLLGRWSLAHGLGTVAADLLDRLNERFEDPDFRIGPAYFMKSTEPDAHSHERLERIWRTSILPLLQEHHYGEWESAQRRYRFNSLVARPVDDEAAIEITLAAHGADSATDPVSIEAE